MNSFKFQEKLDEILELLLSSIQHDLEAGIVSVSKVELLDLLNTLRIK